MASLLSVSDPCCAADSLRGLGRFFHRQGQTMLCEVPLPNGRRADVLAIDGKGMITIVEIKVARADLLGDEKWPDYLPWCDQFCWALAPHLDASLLDEEQRLPDRCGLMIADRYDAAVIRPPALVPVAPARRRSEILRLSRLAMRRLMLAGDPELIAHANERDIGV